MLDLPKPKWKVLKHIDDSWFMHRGKYLRAASDLALMFPCIEIAGFDRTKFVSKMIYMWRDNTPSKTSRSLQKKCEAVIRRMPKLKRIENL